MAPLYNSTEPRLKLSKPRPWTIGAVPHPGDSRSDLKTSLTREPSPIITGFLGAAALQYDTRQERRPLRKELDAGDNNDIDIGRSLRKRFSRTQTAPPKRTSMRMSLGLSRTATLSDGEQVYRHGSVDNLSDATTRRAFRDELAALNQPLETAFEDDDGPEPIISPIRRRSFFTPGLATRNPADMLAKPPKPAPKQQAELEYYYNPRCSTFSPLERIAALDLASRPHTPQVRASTPVDLDYGLIGRLRITNGMASPALSSRSGLRRASTGLCNSVSYSDIADLSLSEETIIQAYLNSARQSGCYQHPLQIVSNQQDTDSQDETVSRVDEPRSIVPSHITRSKSTSALSFQDITSQIAKDYMLVLADNPFGIHPSSYDLQATSKPSEVEAELFEGDSLKSRQSYETLQKSDFLLPDVVVAEDDFERRTSRLLAQIGASDSSLGTAALDTPIDRASLSNADSGYSSNTSVSSLSKKFQSSNSSTIEVQKTRKSPAVAQELQQLTIRPKRRPTPVTIQTSTTIQNSLFSGSLQSSTETLHTAATTISFSTQIPQVMSPKKLQKPRPRSQPPPSNRVAFQMHPEIDPNVVPQVPNELATRMARRLADVPPLNHTLPSVDHLRLTKADLDHPPLSAPIRFPSPEPATNKHWSHAIRSQGKKTKSVRNRRSHLDGLLFQGSRKKSHSMNESAPSLVSPGLVQRFLSNEKISTVGHRSDPELLPSQTRRAVARSKSMATGLSDREASALSHLRSMAKLVDSKPLPGSTHYTRQTSSVYNDMSSPTVSSAWTLATPDLRQSSSVSSMATKSSSVSRAYKATDRVPHTAPLPLSPVGKLYNPANESYKPLQLYGSSSNETLNSQQDTKSLPLLPLMPDVVKKSRSLEKTLPLLPHQKKSIQDMASREPSPYDESQEWSGIDQKRVQHKYRTASSSVSRTSTVQTLREAAGRHTRIQSEPPSIPSQEWQQLQYQAIHSLDANRQPMLPQLDTSVDSQEQHYRDLEKGYKSQSPYRRYLNRTRDSRSDSPEYDQFVWTPPISSTTPELESQQEWPSSAPVESNTNNALKQSQSIPEGLVARLSGRFEGGLSYNYQPGHGIHGSAGTRNTQTGLRKSVETSKGYGLDLTDIPVFIYAQTSERQHEQQGGWL